MSPRDLNDNYVGPEAREVVHLVELAYWDGATEQIVRLTDASQDLDLSVDGGATTPTWVGTGVFISIGDVDESSDLDAPGVDIVFDGVNQSIISVIANNQFRGRPIKLWRVWLDSETGEMAGPGVDPQPLAIFDGFQNEAYQIGESFTEEPEAVRVSTRAVGAISRLGKIRGVKTNTVSHNEMLESAGVATGDTFFGNVPGLQGKEIYWGRDEPGSRRYLFNPDNNTQQGKGG